MTVWDLCKVIRHTSGSAAVLSTSAEKSFKAYFAHWPQNIWIETYTVENNQSLKENKQGVALIAMNFDLVIT